MSNEAITCRFVFTPQEMKRAIRCYWRYSPLKWWLGGILLIPLILTLYPIVFPGSSPSTQVPRDIQNPTFLMSFVQNVLPILIFIGLVVYIFVFQTSRSFRKGTYFNQEMTYTFRDAGVHLATPRVQSEMKWEVFPRVVENRNGFVLFNMGKRSFNWFPKTGFASPESIDQCRNLLRLHVKDSRRLIAS
jgi:hypothetical protein